MPAFKPDQTPAPADSIRGKRVLLLVSGGIASYKSCTLVRRLMDAGCSVRVAMTDSATRFVAPMTFEALSGQAVGTSLWGTGGEDPLDHIQWAREAHAVVVAPATANFLAKMALGLADDLPSTLVTATDVPLLVAPAMNDRMWSNPPNQEHLQVLRSRGVHVVEPGTGFLACGTVAEGRMAEPEEITRAVIDQLAPGPLRGSHVLITGGGTREPIDTVRFIGNRSSGRMGIALAEAARDLGAKVTLLLGPGDLSDPMGVDVHRFETAASLGELVKHHAPSAHMIAMAAAVSDYRVVDPAKQKLKKDDGVPDIQLEASPDILAGLGAARDTGQCLIGFALQTGSDAEVETQASAKLARKHCDLVCGNRADRPGEGFEGDRNRIYLVDRSGHGEWLAPASKRQLSRHIFERAIALFTESPAPTKANRA